MTGKVSIKVKLFVWNRDGWECSYCGVAVVRASEAQPQDAPDTATVDHVHPKALGGPDRPHNLLTACYRCNQAKGCATEASAPTLAEVWPSLDRAERELLSA